MKKSKFTEEQIAFALKQAEAGTPVEQICRKLGVSEATFYCWKIYRRSSRPSPGGPRRGAGGAGEHPGRQRAGVHQPLAGPLGLLRRRDAGLQPAGQADLQRLHRVVQWATPPGVPRLELVLGPGGCAGEDQVLAGAIQPRAPKQCPGLPGPRRVRGFERLEDRAGCHRQTLMGQAQAAMILTWRPDSLSGVGHAVQRSLSNVCFVPN
jgi:Transposase